jgi:hypothetical protein
VARPVHGQQLVDLAGRVRRDAHQHIGELVEHLDPGALAGRDEGVDRRSGPSTAQSAGEQPILPPDGDGTDGALDLVVVDRHEAVAQEMAQELAQLTPLVAHVL